jgi:glycosyltransferase involved in cell wall biosynthesis
MVVQQLVDEKGIEVFEIEESFGTSLQVSRLKIVPVLVRLHGPFLLTGIFDDAASAMPFNNGRAKYEGQAIEAADYITAPCNYARAAVRQHYDFALTNSSIIPTPIASALEEAIWRVDRCNKNKMLFVGRFDSIKGGDFALRVFASLAEVNLDLTLTFVGPDVGIQSDTGTLYFEEFFTQNFPQELRARVDYRGQMGHADLMALRTSHYLTLIAARYDTMGYMLLEAMSFGCPLVSTAVGGIVEVIQNEHNGLLIPAQALDEMINACQRLLNNPELAERLGRQAWLDCRELYSPNAVATQTVEAYNSAIEAFHAKRSA